MTDELLREFLSLKEYRKSMKMYKPKHFELFEFVPRAIWEETPEKKRANLWFLFDERMLITLDRLRDQYGVIYMNDWYWGGNNQDKGYRPPGCDIGAKSGQHHFGRAGDPSFKEISAEEIRGKILHPKNDNDRFIFEYITAIEMDVSWLHFDVRNWNKSENGILTF